MQYIALTQRCNYSCNCCPCITHDSSSDLDFDILKEKIECLSDDPLERITLPGGEPTIYKHFFEVMRLLFQKRKKVIFLTNSSRLSSDDFLNELNVCYPLNNLEIITTLFSVYPGQHDQESGVIGSFANTIKAIHKLLLYGTRVTLKLCITKNNYLQLNSFYDFMRTEFSDDVNFQISGIDYIGMSEKTRYQMMLTCEQIRSQLDPLLKKINYLKLRHLDNRVVFISNLPLCAASLDYSNYFVLNGEMGQIDYLSAQKDMKSRYYDSIKGSELCFQCIAYDNCPGTYSSTFQVMGDAYVTPFR